MSRFPSRTRRFPTDYAVTADGQRFLVNTVVDQPTRPALTVILNWMAGSQKVGGFSFNLRNLRITASA